MEEDKAKKISLGQVIIIILLFAIVVLFIISLVTGIIVPEKTEVKTTSEEDKIQMEDKGTNDEQEEQYEYFPFSGTYYWDNLPEESESIESYISFYGMNLFSLYVGNGNYYLGFCYDTPSANGLDVSEEYDYITCSIIARSSEWHSEPEVLQEPISAEFKFDLSAGSLELINVSSEYGVVYHSVDLITGELEEETISDTLEQFQVGNVYILRKDILEISSI